MLSLYLTAHDSSDLCYSNTGLGNVLYQLSFQYSICKKYNITPNYSLLKQFIKKLESFGLENYHATIFRNFKLTDDICKSNIVLQEGKKAHIYDGDLIEQIVNKDKNIMIKNSYLQSLQYYDEYRDEIQQLFSPDEKSLSEIYSKYPQLTQHTVNVSIHLRLCWGRGLTYNSNFIRDAILYLDKCLKKTDKICFIVFSDNIEKATKILSNLDYNFIYSKGDYDYIDLWTMSLCNHNIICHSTLGWWGAYLNKNPNKIIIYPSDVLTFFCKNVLRRNNIQEIKTNIYGDNWICLNSNSINL